MSLCVLYTNQEFGCTGLLILCTTLPSLDSLWQELDFCCWISSYIFKTTNILAVILMIPIGIDFLKSETSWICWKKSSTQCIILLSTLQWMKARFVQRKAPFHIIHKVKRSRFGIQFYELSTAHGILLDFILYQGNIEPSLIQPPGEGWLQTERIPLTLIDPYLDKGHTLTIDSFYSTPRLAKYLLERKTKTVGTIRHNKKMFPTDFLKDSDIPKGSAVFKHHENILAIKYRAAKNKSDGKPKVSIYFQQNTMLQWKILPKQIMMAISYRNLMPLFTTTKTWEE